MDALLLAVKSYVVDHWSFVAAAVLLGFVLQWLKLNLLQKALCATSKWRRVMRKALPLIAMAIGGLLGLIPGLPTSVGTTTTPGRVLYFALAGVFASYVFNVIRQFGKKYGVELPVGEDEPSSAAGASVPKVGPVPPASPTP